MMSSYGKEHQFQPSLAPPILTLIRQNLDEDFLVFLFSLNWLSAFGLLPCLVHFWKNHTIWMLKLFLMKMQLKESSDWVRCKKGFGEMVQCYRGIISGRVERSLLFSASLKSWVFLVFWAPDENTDMGSSALYLQEQPWKQLCEIVYMYLTCHQIICLFN